MHVYIAAFSFQVYVTKAWDSPGVRVREYAYLGLYCLNSSSPDGRQTWMELSRLSRDEGITPVMIQKNRGRLVNAMKPTLKKEKSLGESIPQSFITAPEYHVDNISISRIIQPGNVSRLGILPVLSPISLLGSAPHRSAGFTDAFLGRQIGAASSKNVDDGKQSLLPGMSSGELSGGHKQNDIEGVMHEEIPFHFEYHVPRFPIVKPGESARKPEKGSTSVNL